MQRKDTLERFIFEKIPIRGEYIRLTKSFQTIVQQHDYPTILRTLLGEALCVVGLLSAIIKFDGKVTVQFRGKGKLKLLLAQCDNQFHLRGLIKWDGDPTYTELMEAFNEGVLVIMLDAGPNKSRYQGVVSWRGNSLAESIEGYFQDSEQLATKVWLTVSDTTAVGFLIQVIPAKSSGTNVDEEIVSSHWEHIIQLTANLYAIDLLSLEYPSLLQMLYPNEEIRIFPSDEVSFGCTCTRKRSADAILLIGKEEAEEELKDKNSLVVTCDFCNTEYIFDRIDVAKIFTDQSSHPSSHNLH